MPASAALQEGEAWTPADRQREAISGDLSGPIPGGWWSL